MRVKFLHNSYWGHKSLPKYIISEKKRYLKIKVKTKYGRVNSYNNPFTPYTIKQWNFTMRNSEHRVHYQFITPLTKYIEN